MSFSSVSNRWLNRVYKILAFLLVLIAVAVSALRLMMPYAQNYKQQLEVYLNEKYQSEVIIGGLSTGWQHLGPVLVAENVSLLQSEAVNVFIDRIDFRLDFWGSVRERQVITNDFILNGAKVFLDKGALLNQPQTEPTSPLLNTLADLFLEQVAHFSLRDSQLIVKEPSGRQNALLISQLAWQNQGNRHRATGDISVDGLTSNSVKLLLDITGRQRAELNGQIYVAADNLDITPWLSQVLVLDNQQTQSSLNFSSWLSIKQGVATRLQVELGDNDISWQYQDQQHQLRSRQGSLLLTSDDSFATFTLASDTTLISIDEFEAKPLVISAQRTHHHFSGYWSLIDLAGTMNLLPLFEGDEQLTAQLAKLSLGGEIQDIYWQLTGEEYAFDALFSDIETHYADGLPGISGLSGRVTVQNGRAYIDAEAAEGALDFGGAFIRPLPYQQLDFSLAGEFSEQGWQVTVPALDWRSPELSLSGELQITSAAEQELQLAIKAEVKGADASNAMYYYPVELMGSDLVDYLNSSLHSGKLPTAKVLVNGPAREFPFHRQQGIFIVDAELTESQFQFDPEWPAIDNFSANLNFTNNSMLITAKDGTLSGLPVSGVSAKINDLSQEQLLTVSAAINQASPATVQQLMNDSPLKSSVGETLAIVEVVQPVDGYFELHVPLNNADHTVATGWVDLQNNQVRLQTPVMEFEQVTGRLHFNNAHVWLTDLDLLWRDHPISLTVNADQQSNYYLTEINLNANWQQQSWSKEVPALLRPYAKGQLPWQGKLSLFIPDNGDFSYQLELNSDLQGIGLLLPAPYQKGVEQSTPFRAVVNGQLNQSTIDAKMGEALSFYGVLNHEQQHFTRSHLILGDEEMLLPMDGFHITAKLASADFGEWQPFILDIIDTIKLSESDTETDTQIGLFSAPERIRGRVDQLAIFGQQLTDTSFNLLDQQHWWLLQLNAKEARTQVKFYPDWFQQGIDINADFVHLPMIDGANETSEQIADKVDDKRNDVVFANIPPMRVKCASCRYGRLDLGAIDFDIERADSDRIKLNKFTAKRGKTQLSFDADWQHNEQSSMTSLTGTMSAGDLEQEIERFGYASIIKDSGINMNFAVHWPGGPHNFALVNSEGKLSAALDDGYLADVSDKGARIFSILSLQSLLRKLTLDFRDIFSDGMFYSKITGDFQLKDGVLYTDNTKMNGSAGDLAIKGNTKLAAGELDYRMSYKPNLTSSLPVLAWIATLNPVTFLAGVAIDEVLISKVVSEFKFELTGDLDEPNLREVNRKTRDISVGQSTPPRFVDNQVNDDSTKPVGEGEQQPQQPPLDQQPRPMEQ